MNSYMICFVAFNLILGIFFTGVMGISFIIKIIRVYPYNFTGHMSSL